MKTADKELLFSVTKKDFDIQYFSGTGAGGQHRNKHQNCVRLRHKDSGVTATGQSNRDRVANLKEAFRSLINNTSFKFWLNCKIQEAFSGITLAESVAKQMLPDKLKVERRNAQGEWEEVNNEKDIL